MTHSPSNAEKSGGARKAFVTRICAAVDEYLAGDLSTYGLAQEVVAAVRDLCRRIAR